MRQSGAFLLVIIVSLARADEPPDPYAKRIAPASAEGIKAIARFRVPAGLQVNLFAAEPLLANPVAFCIDNKGRFYVAETFRLHRGVTDNRNHMNWLADDLACHTVADRLALYKKYLGKDYDSYGVDHDRVRLIEDRDGDGKADHATIFADGFNTPADGLGSGVLARGKDVWYTCIPNLWLLCDTKGTGRADVRKALHTGYGVHVSFIGHDSHGLRFGPDGKLYFSIGDRGLHVETEGRVISCPDTGAVLRCNPDGSELEIVATGLRNPQELAFDKYGNLFTGDNNADSGDAARWVYVVEGGDSGWRIGYQYLRSPVALGPWNQEKIWHVQHDTQPAYVVPPLAHIANGPSGLSYHPGVTLLPKSYRDRFFLCDFRGGAGGSGIHSFAVKPRGAGFELVDRKQFVWSVLATDCEFGPDGGFYLCDWVDGWGLPNKGRIYKVFEPGRLQDAQVAEVKRLLAEGLTQRGADELCRLLEHTDMRVRREAQFALAERGADAALARVSRKGLQLARLHAIWGLGQIGRKYKPAYRQLLTLAADKDAEVRAQAVKVLGESRAPWTYAVLLPRLKDAEPRVRFFAALSLGKVGNPSAVPRVFDMLQENADKDPYLRHAGVMALAGIKDVKALRAAASDPSVSIRLAATLAIRRLEIADVAIFLKDTEPRVVAEAARAINDVPISAAMPALAGLIEHPTAATSKNSPFREAILSRGLNAQFRLGKKENAVLLARFAAGSGNPESLRIAALRYLSSWAKPPRLDRITGLSRPLPARSEVEVRDVLRPALGGIMSGSDRVRAECIRLAGALGIREVGPALRELTADKLRPASVRIEALRALEAIKDSGLDNAAKLALDDADPKLRHEGRRVLLKREPADAAVKNLIEVLEHGAQYERQGALALLAGLKTIESDAVLARWLDQLVLDKAPAEIALDILEAVRQRGTPDLKIRLLQYETSRPKSDALGKYRPSLLGGDAERGKDIFFQKAEVSCVRCHKVAGVGGEVGPDLTGIGTRQKRDYLLEAIVDPNKEIAKGFETVVLVLTNGKTHSGILKSEDSKEVRIMTPEGQMLSVPKDQIEERGRGKSAMPDDVLRFLSAVELRDVVEFLAGLRDEPKGK